MTTPETKTIAWWAAQRIVDGKTDKNAGRAARLEAAYYLLGHGWCIDTTAAQTKLDKQLVEQIAETINKRPT